MGMLWLFGGVMIGVSVMGLFCGVKNNVLLDEMYNLDKTLCDKEQGYCKLRIDYNGLEESYDMLMADYNKLKGFNDYADKMILKLIEKTKIGGTK